MRHPDAIDGDLRLVAAVRRSVIEAGHPAPRLDIIDQLLDERTAALRGNHPGTQAHP